jgi:hypothetical protein
VGSEAQIELPRHVVSITGPGDPRWTGPPDDARIRRIKQLTDQDSRGRRFYLANGGWKRLETAADFAALNHSIRFTTYTNTNYPIDGLPSVV